MVKLTIESKEHQYEDGISYEIIAREFQPDYSDRIALVTMNGKIRELTKKTDTDGVLNFITMKDNIAHKTYVRTAIMIMLKAVRDCIGADSTNHVKIEFTIGPGYYCSFNDGLKVSKDQIDDIKDKMKSLIEADLPITKKSYPKDEAIALFKRLGMNDKVEVFKYRRSSAINIYCLGDYYDYFYGYMMPFTGYVDLFDLIPYENGMMLVLPANGRPDVLPEFQPREHLFNSLMGTNNWNLQFGIDNVGDLNDAVCSGRIKDLIFVQEALQERRIGEIAKMISDRDKVKFVMIAGPSSSGKTTFSHRLSIQLQTYGLTPHYVGLDNYYLDHDKTPVDEEGNPDYECLEALDVERWNLLNPGEPKQTYISKVFEGASGVFVASSDYIKAIPDSISKWVPGRLITLGTDGFGRSEGRKELRDFFEVDARYVTVAALYGLMLEGKVKQSVVDKAIEELDIDKNKLNPMIS